MRVQVEYRLFGYDKPVASAKTVFNEEGTKFCYESTYWHNGKNEWVTTTGDHWFTAGQPADEVLAGQLAVKLLNFLNRVAKTLNEVNSRAL